MKTKPIKIIMVVTVLLLAVAAGIIIPRWLHPGEETVAGPGQNTVQNQEISRNTPTENANTTEETAAPSEEPAEEPLPDPSVEPLEEPPSAPPAEQNWVEEKIALHRDQIADEDLEDFRLIMGKLDIDHVEAILEGRIDPEIDNTLRAYLNDRLTPREYQRSKELFIDYEHLIFE